MFCVNLGVEVNMTILEILFAIMWIYILTVLTRSKLDFWKFCWGSVGFFILMMLWLQPIAVNPLTKAVASISGIIGSLTDMYSSYFQYGMLFITNHGSSISLYIDYECSGIIEIMAFTSLLWFFNVYNFFEKLVINIFGFIWIFIANVLRIFVICALIYFFGNSIFYFAHTIFGRLIFYTFSIILYFFVFTKSHIIRQKVGNFNYGHN
nr:exosortase family protein XrtG [Ruminiclostridium sufflavum]